MVVALVVVERWRHRVAGGDLGGMVVLVVVVLESQWCIRVMTNSIRIRGL